jgi:hypothetical protein
VWLSLTCLDEYLEAFGKGEERLMRRFLVGVSLGISGAFDSTTFRKKTFPELLLLFPLKLNVFENCSTRDLRLAGLGEGLKKVVVGIGV